MSDRSPVRVALVSLNMDAQYGLAVGYLKAYALRDPEIRRRMRFAILQQSIRAHTDVVALRILARRPQIVGFSCYVWNVHRVLKLARRLKQLAPGIRIVLGGQEVTHSNVDWLAVSPAVDVLVGGEGERTFQLLLRAWLEDRWAKLDGIPGITFRRDGQTVVHPPAPLIEDLDDIPSPYLSGDVVPPPDARLGMMVESARGCPFRCGFCFEGERYPRVRTFSLERLEHELAWAASRGQRTFHILDPVLAMGKVDRLRAIHELLERHLVPNGPFEISVEVHAELITEEMLPYLRHFSILDIGLQTVTPAALHHIRRKLDVPRFLRGVELLKRLGKRTNLYLIYGLPGEDYFGFLRSAQFAIERDVTQLFINHLCVLNGTDLRQSKDRLRLRHEPAAPYLVRSSATFSEGDVQLARVFGASIVREHDATVPPWPDAAELSLIASNPEVDR